MTVGTKPLLISLDDRDAERVRLNHEQRITELQGSAGGALTVLGDFTVPNGGFVLVSHALGRRPTQVILSPPKVEIGTAGLTSGGILVDQTGASVDRTRLLRIFATGYGVPVTVTVSVL